MHDHLCVAFYFLKKNPFLLERLKISWKTSKMFCNKNMFKKPFYVWFMSYSKCWNCSWTWNLYICFEFSAEKKQFGTFSRCLNSKEIKLQGSGRVIWFTYFYSAENLRIILWHEPDISYQNRKCDADMISSLNGP